MLCPFLRRHFGHSLLVEMSLNGLKLVKGEIFVKQKHKPLGHVTGHTVLKAQMEGRHPEINLDTQVWCFWGFWGVPLHRLG